MKYFFFAKWRTSLRDQDWIFVLSIRCQEIEYYFFASAQSKFCPHDAGDWIVEGVLEF